MKLPPIQILVIDVDTDVLTAVSYLLRSTGATVTTEKNSEQIPSLLATKKFDVILLDMHFKSVIHSGNEGIN
jgi:CheY-like chemotaxis protein